MPHVICSACKGSGELFVYDERYPDDPPTRHYCNICEGKCIIQIEDNTNTVYTSHCYHMETLLELYSPPTLRRNELTRAAKKEHLESLHLHPEEIEKTLASLYPSIIEPPSTIYWDDDCSG